MIPENLIKHMTTLNKLTAEQRSVLFKRCLDCMSSPGQNRREILVKLNDELELERSRTIILLSACMQLIKLFLVTNDKELVEISEKLGLSSNVMSELIATKRNEQVTKSLCQNNMYKTTFRVNWMIDVSLYNKLSNKFAKSVIIQINLQDGKRHTLEIDVKTFHKLRYTIALLMKEMTSMKQLLP